MSEGPFNSQQNPDGSWSPATPMEFIGWKATLEQFFRKRKLTKIANFFAKWDERGLGK